jgi:hypothetical protein
MYHHSFKTDDNIPEPQINRDAFPPFHPVMWTDAVSRKLIIFEHKMTLCPETKNYNPTSKITYQLTLMCLTIQDRDSAVLACDTMQSCWLSPIFRMNMLPPSLGSTSTLKICLHLGSTSKTTLSQNPEQQNLKTHHHKNVKSQEC